MLPDPVGPHYEVSVQAADLRTAWKKLNAQTGALKVLKEFGFDPGGPAASERLRQTVEQALSRKAERARPINLRLLTRTARRIWSMGKGGED